MSTEQNPDPEPEATGSLPRSRIARYDQYFDQRTFSDTLRKTAKPANVNKKYNQKKPVLMVLRIIDRRGQLSRRVVNIMSSALCAVLEEINKDAEGLELSRNPPSADPRLFFHSHEGLLKRHEMEKMKENPNTALLEDLSVALQYIQEDYGENINDFKRLLKHNDITYDLLWALFAPNTPVYSSHELTEQDQILLVRSVAYEISDGVEYLSLSCDIVTCDGKLFGLARDNNLKVFKYVGARKIRDLPVYPLKYHEDESSLNERVIKRGKKFAKLTRPTYQEISGLAMREVKSGLDAKIFKFNSYGRMMVDPTAFRSFEPNCAYNLPVHKGLNRNELTDEEYAICTPVVLGFCFGAKTWGGFAIDRTRDIEWSDEAFNSLVLGPKHKALVHSLVKQHKHRAALFDDVVAGKGKGLVGLLSGNPGCGKTLTAEAVAEVTHRPLYVVSAGELGTDPTRLDESLTIILELARTWDAVLLLDEAEVFLQKRSPTDIKRNALVSIFLRQLEYYQGILILTTNMFVRCDQALESRIHFAIHYPDLGPEARKTIWKTFITKALKSQNSPTEITEDDISRLAERDMNGREIKNAVSNAQSIALEAGTFLAISHINDALEIISEWKARSRDGNICE